MPKIKILGGSIQKVSSSIRKSMIKELRSQEIRKEIGEAVASDIQKTFFWFPAESTIKQREYLEQGNDTHHTYNRSKINITFTGELIDDLRKNVKTDFSPKGVKYLIEHSDKKHKKYKTPDGRSIGKKRSTFKQISEGISRNYNYLVLKQSTIDKVVKLIKDILIKNIKV